MAFERHERVGFLRAIGTVIVWIIQKVIAVLNVLSSSSRQSSRVQSLRITRNATVSGKVVKVVSVKRQKGSQLQGSVLSEELLREISNQSGVSVAELNDLLGEAQIGSRTGEVRDGVHVTVSTSPNWKVEVNTQTLGDSLVSGAVQLPLRDDTKNYQAQRTKIQTQLVVCPKCHHKTQQGQWCLYCGQNLSQVAENKPVINEVDQKFLQSDVNTESQAENKQEQKIRDSFEDRLKDL